MSQALARLQAVIVNYPSVNETEIKGSTSHAKFRLQTLANSRHVSKQCHWQSLGYKLWQINFMFLYNVTGSVRLQTVLLRVNRQKKHGNYEKKSSVRISSKLQREQGGSYQLNKSNKLNNRKV